MPDFPFLLCKNRLYNGPPLKYDVCVAVRGRLNAREFRKLKAQRQSLTGRDNCRRMERGTADIAEKVGPLFSDNFASVNQKVETLIVHIFNTHIDENNLLPDIKATVY